MRPLSSLRRLVTDSKGTVLVIDDEEPVRQVAAEILGYLGYSVTTSASGEAGVKLVQEGMRPDVVLLDVIMPGMNGFQTLRKLREIEPDMPILICTGYSDRKAAESLVNEGADGFVNKPYNIETLAKQIEKLRGETKRHK
jgi:CheY-like chemotaxis protein